MLLPEHSSNFFAVYVWHRVVKNNDVEVVLIGERNPIDSFAYRKNMEAFGMEYRFADRERSRVIVDAQNIRHTWRGCLTSKVHRLLGRVGGEVK